MTAETVIPVRIELDEPLVGFVASPYVQQLERRLEAELDALVERLGLRGRVDVELVAAPSSRLVRIVVHGHLLPYPPELLRRAWLAVAQREHRWLPDVAQLEARPGFAAAWLAAYAAEPSADLGLIASFFERLAAQAVLDRPSCLVGEAQLEDYGRALREPIDGLERMLATLLDLGVAVADRELIATRVAEGKAVGRPLDDTIEALFTELQAHRIEIAVHPATLDALTGGSGVREPVSVYDDRLDETRQRLFRDFEQTFFETFGFLLPSIVWVPSGVLAERTVAVRIGTWRSLPVPMPPEDTRLVLAPSSKLSGFDAEATFDPLSGAPCSIVRTELREELEKEYTTWGPVDFTLVILGSELSRRVSTLLGMEEVEYQLAQLSLEPNRLLTDTSFLALTQFSLGDLTRVLRALVAEHLSIVDLSGLLERLVQFDVVEIDYEMEEPIVFDDRLPVSPHARDTVARWRLAYAFLRRQLKPYLSHFHGGREKQILAYSLDPELEDLARRADRIDDDRLTAFRDAVCKEFSGLAPSASHAIITKTEARHPIRDLLAPELPDLPILAYSELTPAIDIKWLGRIDAFTAAGSVD